MCPPHPVRLLALLAVVPLTLACNRDRPASVVVAPMPDTFHVALATSKGDVLVEVYKEWSPHGAERFYQLVSEGFFDDQRFFRVIPQYIAQFGASADPKKNDRWDDAKIPDDRRTQSNARGTLSFAAEAPNTRSHQLFFNLKDNPKLDPQNFIPIGRVVEGMSVLDSLYDDYGDTPKYRLVASLGNEYLHRMFPRMDYIKTARIVGAAAPATSATKP
ncbi:MAG: peptidylprolyl isomerase [Gemmatimonadetes bacterium]|nr:MAG: peptidylprolyl isomerase [Gemmatimonadota bacterium]